MVQIIYWWKFAPEIPITLPGLYNIPVMQLFPGLQDYPLMALIPTGMIMRGICAAL
jgi:hypothetical protein